MKAEKVSLRHALRNILESERRKSYRCDPQEQGPEAGSARPRRRRDGSSCSARVSSRLLPPSRRAIDPDMGDAGQMGDAGGKTPGPASRASSSSSTDSSRASSVSSADAFSGSGMATPAPLKQSSQVNETPGGGRSQAMLAKLSAMSSARETPGSRGPLRMSSKPAGDMLAGTSSNMSSVAGTPGAPAAPGRSPSSGTRVPATIPCTVSLGTRCAFAAAQARPDSCSSTRVRRPPPRPGADMIRGRGRTARCK